ncbi:MAG: ribonuclease D [Porticoccaceae bacterium]|nr:ribonuclease D [Porticoccaceae bacterium]
MDNSVVQTGRNLPTPIRVEDQQTLVEGCRQCESVSRIAIDTEFMRTDTFFAILALIQISDGKSVWLIDPLAIENLEPLRHLLENPGVVKVFHSCSEDLEVLQQALGIVPSPLFDTQIAAAMAGYGHSLGYARLVNAVLGIELDKHETRSDWLQRPLTDAQCQYAAEDVFFLVRIYDHLISDLPGERIAWIEEDMARLVAGAREPVDPELYYLKVKGAGRLPEHEQSLLKALCAWRERLARQENKPRGRIVSDSALLEIVQRKPTARNQLFRIQGFHPQAVRQYGEALMDQLDHGLAHDGVPEGFEIVDPPLDPDQRRLLKALRQVVEERAGELELAPEILARKKELEVLVRSGRSGAGLLVTPLNAGWRYTAIGRELKDYVESMPV